FVITTVIGSALIFAFGFYLYKISGLLNGNLYGTAVSVYNTAMDHSLGNYHREYQLAPWIVNTIKYFMQYAWAPIFWVVSWFRLKEKQI
ncbi:MAG: hypothetical protein ABI151_04475, partial [Chitinophagaceae bacterium]